MVPVEVAWSMGDFGEGVVFDVAAVGEGFVAVRYEGVGVDGPGGAEIVVSDDGLEWVVVPGGPVTADDRVMWLSGSRWGVAGVVSNRDSAAAPPELILSTDGKTWTGTNLASVAAVASGAGFVVDAVWGEDGVVAIYASDIDSPSPSISILFSETGEVWALSEAPAGMGFARTIIASDAGFVLLEELDDPGAPGMAGWFSATGQFWERVSVTDAIISGSGGSTGWREGFVVIRDVFDPSNDTYGPTMWDSVDGMAWSASTTDPFTEVGLSGAEDSLQGSDAGLVTVGVTAHDHTDDDPVDIDQFVMFSSNGMEWIKWDTEDLFGSDALAGQYAISSELILVPVLDEEASDFDTNALVTNLWVGLINTTTLQ